MKKIFNKTQKGFTLIELLIVIAILGILATAVLSAINPVEQINRGRDTGSQSDAEQLVGAILRFNAAQGYFPWQSNGNDTANGGTAFSETGWTKVTDVVDVTPNGWYEDNNVAAPHVAVLDKLGSTAVGASRELQQSFVTKVVAADYNPLYVYNKGDIGQSTYVCFKPKSGSFKTAAKNRCGAAGAGLPDDLQGMKDTICDDAGDIFYTCLP